MSRTTNPRTSIPRTAVTAADAGSPWPPARSSAPAP